MAVRTKRRAIGRMREKEGGERASPRSRRILKLRLLILSWGESGKQEKQLRRVCSRSVASCAMIVGLIGGELYAGSTATVEFRCVRSS